MDGIGAAPSVGAGNSGGAQGPSQGLDQQIQQLQEQIQAKRGEGSQDSGSGGSGGSQGSGGAQGANGSQGAGGDESLEELLKKLEKLLAEKKRPKVHKAVTVAHRAKAKSRWAAARVKARSTTDRQAYKNPPFSGGFFISAALQSSSRDLVTKLSGTQLRQVPQKTM